MPRALPLFSGIRSIRARHPFGFFGVTAILKLGFNLNNLLFQSRRQRHRRSLLFGKR